MRCHRAALADFTGVLTLDPHYAWAYAARGYVHLTLGDMQAALADLGRSLALEPVAAWPRCWRGETHRVQRCGGEAFAGFGRVIVLWRGCGWLRCRSAFVVCLSGVSLEGGWWWRALVIYETQAAAAETGDLARSDLLVVLCGLPDWDCAESRLELFLLFSPSWHQVAEGVGDVEGFRCVVSVGGWWLAVVLGGFREVLEGWCWWGWWLADLVCLCAVVGVPCCVELSLLRFVSCL